MPIYEFECTNCGEVFETICLKIDDSTTSPCPNCNGTGQKLISAPAIVFETFDKQAYKLPDWDQKMAQAKAHDDIVCRAHGIAPLDHDRGKAIRTYQMEFGHDERRTLESKAQLDNMG